MKRKTGFIGTGTMGLPMAQQLANAALEPLIHDLSKDRIAPLLDKGAIWCESLTELAQHCDTVFLSLPGPRQVEAVVAGSGGLLDKLARGSAIVDLSTSSVATARSMEKLCAAKGIGFLDSPVSGGEKRAADGSLILMVGGKEQTLEQVRPQLQLLSREILHLGGAGCGTVAKLINNQLYLCGEILFYEGLALASKAGLDLEQLVHILDESGAGGVHTKLAERVLAGRFDDNTFALALAEKDVSLSLQAGDSLGVPMGVTAAAHDIFREARDAGMGEKNFWAAVRIIEDKADTAICKQEGEPK